VRAYTNNTCVCRERNMCMESVVVSERGRLKESLELRKGVCVHVHVHMVNYVSFNESL